MSSTPQSQADDEVAEAVEGNAPSQAAAQEGRAAAAAPPSAERLGVVRASAPFQREAPDEVMGPATDDEYLDYRAQTDMREPYRIPAEYLLGTKRYIGPDVADTPLVVFINAKSGGRVGPRLLTVLFRSLGQAQVFDLAESRPGPVLRRLWDTLLEREGLGDKLAAHIRTHLRILAAGGDGTVTWILKTVADLGLDPPPAVAVMPLGTGNDLSLSFGWGNAFQPSWIQADNLYATLKRFADAEPHWLDCWSVSIKAPDAALFQELPYALHMEEDNPTQADGKFWNYLSIGLDAEAAYSFHHLREQRPWAAPTRLANQAWYSYFSCTSGWFCGAEPLTNKLRLRVRGGSSSSKAAGGADAGEWREVVLPRSVRAVVLLNLQSYGGGRDIWGLSDGRGAGQQQFSDPIFDDGLIEVVGFSTGWHAAVVMGQVNKNLHALRLAQCSEVEIELAAHGSRVKGETGLTHMQVDGEPWAQPIPAAASAGGASAPLVVRVQHGGRSEMLLNGAAALGGKRVRQIAERGARRSEVVAGPQRHLSAAWQNGPGVDA